jgi:hypothetical protein
VSIGPNRFINVTNVDFVERYVFMHVWVMYVCTHSMHVCIDAVSIGPDLFIHVTNVDFVGRYVFLYIWVYQWVYVCLYVRMYVFVVCMYS